MATSGPASTRTPRTSLLANDRRELLTGRSQAIARADADHADDVEPGVVREGPSRVATVGGRVLLQRVSDDVRARLTTAACQGVHGALGSCIQPNGQRHGKSSVIQISMTAALARCQNERG